jgi:hypothetical protein
MVLFSRKGLGNRSQGSEIPGKNLQPRGYVISAAPCQSRTHCFIFLTLSHSHFVTLAVVSAQNLECFDKL